jgi:8-oxo-dGTP diphosphatase
MEAFDSQFIPTREVDELRWLTLAEAHETLSRASDRDVLERFVRGPVSIRMVLLVRHARAGNRSSWEGDDRLRPLDQCGWAQAHSLVRLLAHFEPREVISADYLRCTQTVEPLAQTLGLEIREEPLLSESVYPGREDEAVALIRSVGDRHGASVACSQGDVIPDLLVRLTRADDVDLPVNSWRKASTWALTFDGERLLAAEHFDAPRLPECGAEAENPPPWYASIHQLASDR